MKYIVDFFAMVMAWCNQVCGDYWIAIGLFTLVTKVIQLPISLWCQRNSIAMVALMPKMNRLKVKYFGDKDRIGDESAKLFMEEHYHPLLSLVPLAVQIIILMAFVQVIYGIAESDKEALIGRIPMKDGGIAWIMPLLAGLGALILGWSQNRMNPLQREQTRAQQMTTNGISIAISLFLGACVGMGVGLYWALSNVFSIAVQWVCNLVIPAKKYVDYPALRESQQELSRLEELGKKVVSKADRQREKADYKRFFSIVNKHLVIYSESSGFYRYFKGIVEWLLAHSNLTIHYVTNDPKDQIFGIAEGNPRIKPYYIGPMRIIPLMMKMDADMVLMTVPDLDRYQIKRSYVRKDVEYVYVFHWMTSTHMVLRENGLDNFDTLFTVGPHMEREVRAAERLYGTKEKRLVPTGYGLLDDLVREYEGKKTRSDTSQAPTILIAPSYQDGNILESCIDDLVASLASCNCKVVVRPHPQFGRRHPDRLAAVVLRLKKFDNVTVEETIASNMSVFSADLIVTDWSTIAYEYAYTTKKPALFINTPMKVINQHYKKINLPVLDIILRDEIGISVDLDAVRREAGGKAKYLLSHREEYKDSILDAMEKYLYGVGHAAEKSGEYILKSLVARKKGA